MKANAAVALPTILTILGCLPAATGQAKDRERPQVSNSARPGATVLPADAGPTQRRFAFLIE
jgi:hypothetical protein